MKFRLIRNLVSILEQRIPLWLLQLTQEASQLFLLNVWWLLHQVLEQLSSLMILAIERDKRIQTSLQPDIKLCKNSILLIDTLRFHSLIFLPWNDPRGVLAQLTIYTSCNFLDLLALWWIERFIPDGVIIRLKVDKVVILVWNEYTG